MKIPFFVLKLSSSLSSPPLSPLHRNTWYVQRASMPATLGSAFARYLPTLALPTPHASWPRLSSKWASPVAKSVEELSKTLGELKHLRGETFEFQMSHAQTWVNAALTNKDTCLNGFQGVDGKKMIMNAAKVTSNALYMINRLDGSHGRHLLSP
ncbi:ARM repeat superfamily protein isoform 1 [Hibiscus syriacus]|uniref:ARM repeat superfamily protein isoform 1 n=1 Tax=Hibiscus syriacus TaxID=106335 RepID=A0A6A2X2Q3_HIBSY|nr:ARM repeat superfamily protein isoform 1 [Hibiscus syriacus]